jgi:hypothetical protein
MLKKKTTPVKPVNEESKPIRFDFHHRDIMWMIRFSSSMKNNKIHELLCNPVKFVSDRCEEDIKIGGYSFIKEQPITITFSYGSKIFDPSVNKSAEPEFIAFGMHGSNNIYVQCPDIILDPQSLGPVTSKSEKLSTFLGKQQFDPKVNIVIVEDTYSIIAHYDLQLEGAKNEGYDPKEIVVNDVASLFIQNPYMAVYALNNAKKELPEYVHMKKKKQRKGENEKDIDVRFYIGDFVKYENSKKTVGFQFVCQTPPLSVKEPEKGAKIEMFGSKQSALGQKQNVQEASILEFVPSNCLTFTASYSPTDPNSILGILIAELNNGLQMRWVPSPPPQGE